ncbi:MAG: hypothetical protein Greene07147_537 [Parcubacteria group bacterium Greene0714_7]|nr:MAG: hypothetical protein Greene07147_537 [Parcubacteria group bacterium Greene0714_7]
MERYRLTTPTHHMMHETEKAVSSTQLAVNLFFRFLLLSANYFLQTRLTFHVMRRFGLLPFRSPLLGEFQNPGPSAKINLQRDRDILLVSFPLGTEMFHFPRCASRTRARDIFRKKMGFPIRTFSDQCLLVSSPKLFADRLRPSSLYRV